MRWSIWMNKPRAVLQSLLATTISPPDRVGGRSLAEWEAGWRRIGLLTSAHLTAPRDACGLFRLRLHGEIVYLGRSDAAYADCLRQSLRALILGEGALEATLALRLRSQISELVVEILLTGSKKLVRPLETRMLQQSCPAWNNPQQQPDHVQPPSTSQPGECHSG